MKNILVPTDFSACATHATNAAFEIAHTTGASIHLYTNIDIDTQWEFWSETQKKEYPQALQKIRNAKALLSQWQEKATEEGVGFHSHWSGGNLVQYIKQYTKDNQIDFIVMGSHGTSGKNEYFIGSNTQKVVRMVHCPVMVIKNEINSTSLRKVAFASNFDEVEKKAFQYLLDFVRQFQPEIHLLQINTSSWFTQPYPLVKESMEDFKAMCGDLKCYTHFYRDWTIDAGIRHLAEDIGADLIAISNQKKHPIKRMFSGSNVEALVNHADIPVLSIDFPVNA